MESVTIAYITLQESVRQDYADRALRHLKRGMDYARQGKPEYAEGSFRKAHKNLVKLLGAMVERSVVDILAAEVARDLESLLLGQPNSLTIITDEVEK